MVKQWKSRPDIAMPLLGNQKEANAWATGDRLLGQNHSIMELYRQTPFQVPYTRPIPPSPMDEFFQMAEAMCEGKGSRGAMASHRG